jgi:hypothetical protein
MLRTWDPVPVNDVSGACEHSTRFILAWWPLYVLYEALTYDDSSADEHSRRFTWAFRFECQYMGLGPYM